MNWKQPIPTNVKDMCGGHPAAATLYILLLLRASNEDGFRTTNTGEQVFLKRGQCFCGRHELAQSFGLRQQESGRIRRLFKILTNQTTHLITKQKSRNGSIITILNYDDVIKMDNQTTHQTTHQRHINDTSTATNKNDKNDNNNIAAKAACLTKEEKGKIDYKAIENTYLSLLDEYGLPKVMINYGKFRRNLPKVLSFLAQQNETIENYWRWYLAQFRVKEGGREILGTEKFGTEPSVTLSTYFINKFINEK
jgi:hypothetical protein